MFMCCGGTVTYRRFAFGWLFAVLLAYWLDIASYLCVLGGLGVLGCWFGCSYAG